MPRYRTGDVRTEYEGEGVNPFGGVTKGLSEALTPETALLERYGERGGRFGTAGQREFGDVGRQLGGDIDLLRDQATGRVSLSGEQLRQGLQQNLSAQQSFAASARPANQAGAARTAAIQMGRLGAGYSGQAAIAGIQERQAAQQAIINAELQRRQQALQAALGGYGLAVQAGGSIAGVPTAGQILLGGARDVGAAALAG